MKAKTCIKWTATFLCWIPSVSFIETIPALKLKILTLQLNLFQGHRSWQLCISDTEKLSSLLWSHRERVSSKQHLSVRFWFCKTSTAKHSNGSPGNWSINCVSCKSVTLANIIKVVHGVLPSCWNATVNMIYKETSALIVLSYNDRGVAALI